MAAAAERCASKVERAENVNMLMFDDYTQLLFNLEVPNPWTGSGSQVLWYRVTEKRSATFLYERTENQPVSLAYSTSLIDSTS